MKRQAITLIELLIVVAILGLLVQMTIPAVEMSHEKARQTSCANNLRQLALAAQLHVNSQEHFPTGGWGWRWAGEPDRGFGEEQPGGWTFNILPYIEETSLRELGRGSDDLERRAAGALRVQTPVGILICPSRRLASTSPNVAPKDYLNIDRPKRLAKCDYAANSGDRLNWDSLRFRSGPATLDEGDNAKIEPPLNDDGSEPDRGKGFMWSRIAREGTGMVYLRSCVKPNQVLDGLGSTYLFGEKYLEPTDYRTGKNPGDDQSWDVGFDKDICRWTQWGLELEPCQDRLGDRNVLRFGSSHPQVMSFVFADGSVRVISYGIDSEVHAQLGNRSDGYRVSFDDLPTAQ